MSEIIALKRCPKVYRKETHRCKVPEGTAQDLEALVHELGMTALGDATEVDRIGLPVFLCTRVRPDGSRATHTGKGLSKTQARVSLLMESVERFSSEFRPEHRGLLTEGSFARLSSSRRVLDPAETLLPEFSNYSQDRVLSWVTGYDLISREAILVPACSVFHPYPGELGPLAATHTNGIASGNTLEEAIFHAVCEVIERDAWSIAKFNQSFSEAIILDAGEETKLLWEVVEKYEAASIQVTARNITSDTGVPTIAAFSEDLLHPRWKVVEGFGTHLDPRVAMARALLEIATTRALFLSRDGGLDTEEPFPHYLGNGHEDPRLYASGLQHLEEIPNQAGDDVLEDLQFLLQRIWEKGFARVIAVDLTHPVLKIPTVRVVIPGMEVHCFDRSRRGPRLHSLHSQGIGPC